MSKDSWNHLDQDKERIISGDAIAILWSIEDVYERAGELELPIDSEAARQVLDRLKQGHDANYGITWDTIDSVVQDVVKEEEERKVLGSAAFMAKKILELQRKLGFHGEHPGVSRSDWRCEVAAGNSQLGYWEYVVHTLERLEDETKSD